MHFAPVYIAAIVFLLLLLLDFLLLALLGFLIPPVAILPVPLAVRIILIYSSKESYSQTQTSKFRGTTEAQR